LDAKLPQQPAEDVIAVAAGLMPDASVVMVTGYPDSATKSTAIKKGAKLILPKPLTEEVLSAILHRKPKQPPC
jgi:ActR/RegA family two-component response regulator